jgi:hypothetical protein
VFTNQIYPAGRTEDSRCIAKEFAELFMNCGGLDHFSWSSSGGRRRAATAYSALNVNTAAPIVTTAQPASHANPDASEMATSDPTGRV